MDNEAKRQALVDSLKHITPEMRERLRDLKREGEAELKRPDFVWHILLQSFATWGGDRGHQGLIGNQDNYSRVSFKALSNLDASERPSALEKVFLAAKVRNAVVKAKLMARNYDLVANMGGPVEATRQALAQDGREAKIAFMKSFHGIGPKYARNIWMDAYHPDFHDTMAIDLRIKKITKALGCSFKTYEEEERFYQGIAREAGLQGWELDRLLYNYTDHFLSAIAASEGEQQGNRADRFGWGVGDIMITKGAEHDN
jgi:hypothetical protein